MINSHLFRVAVATAAACTLAVFVPFEAATGAAGHQGTNPRQRQVYVGVVDQAGAPVTDLATADFSIREDGVAREVLRVEPATDPIEVALLVDNSAAMAQANSDVRVALGAFVQALNPRNPIALITFAERPTILLNYALDRSQVTKAVERIFPIEGSGTMLLAAIVEAAKGVEKRGAGRAAIVVITGEGQEFSDLQYESVVGAIKACGAAFHAEVITNTGGRTMDDGGRNRGLTLDRGSSISGGRYRTLLSSMAVAGELKSLAAELNNQYRLVYARPESLIPPEKLEVSTKRPGLTVRATPAKVRPGS